MRTLGTAFLLVFFTVAVFGQNIKSPDGKLELNFRINDEGTPVYRLAYKGKTVVRESRLGIELKDSADLMRGFRIVNSDVSEKNEVWSPVWGEVRAIRNQYREFAATLEQTVEGNLKRTIVLRFRLFDDGLGYRYEFPAQNDLKYFTVKEEATEINLTGDHKAFWIPGDYDTNEYAYSTTRLSGITSKTKSENAGEIGTRVAFADNAVQTPLMLKSDDGLYINIHEAALKNYPAMYLIVDKGTFGLKTHLAPNAVGSKAFLQTPAKTPWRTVIVSDKAADILASKMILNLNEPTEIKDTSWIKPQKFVGVWWEMHVGKSTWNYSDAGNIILTETDWGRLKPNGKHGATTENTKRYIDFAAKNGIDSVLVEGWNVGWEDWYGNWKEEVFDFLTPYPDFDVAELKKYAASRGVKLVMHHETSASATNYERRVDDAFRFMKENGYDAVKTGYVGRIIPRGEFHDGQWMVNHYNRIAEKAAGYKIMVDSHESVRPTGLHRTYPNWMAAEAARGNEFNAWSEGNPPEHETILPFTRLMGGPMDYTPGIFQIKMSAYDPVKREQVHTTLAKQLALYVTLYSPFQMAADLPENYEKHMDAFQFIRDVAVDWDDTKILEAEPGDFLTIARKAKNKNQWFIGAITDENARTAEIPVNFLSAGKTYLATIYRDGTDAHWEKNPQSYLIENFLVTGSGILKIRLAEGGGAAVSLREATAEDRRKYRNY
ncbi:MAG: glycoside hydrolase family 97 protein [Pyrinomonadaceae bacterium]